MGCYLLHLPESASPKLVEASAEAVRCAKDLLGLRDTHYMA
jgi:hypothetical protein